MTNKVCVYFNWKLGLIIGLINFNHLIYNINDDLFFDNSWKILGLLFENWFSIMAFLKNI